MSSTNKTIQVIARYFVIATSAIIYLIVNGGGKRYHVTLHADGSTACEEIIPAQDGKPEATQQCMACQHGHTCYYKTSCIAVEGLRASHMAERGTLTGFVFAAPVEKNERKSRSYTFEVPTTVEEMVKLREVCDRTTSKAERKALCNLFASMADERGIIAIADRQWCYDADIQGIFEVIQIVPQMLPECPANEKIIQPTEEAKYDHLFPMDLKIGSEVEVPPSILADCTETRGIIASHVYICPLDRAYRCLVDLGSHEGVVMPLEYLQPVVSTDCPIGVAEMLPELPLAEEESLDTEPLTEEELALFEQVDNEPIVLTDEIKVEEEWSVTNKEDAPEQTKAQVIMTVRQCAMDLVSVCDGARDDDGTGCNGVDADYMHRMAGREMWNPGQIVGVAKRLQKYNRTQLGGRVPSVATVEQALGIMFKGTQRMVAASLNQRNQGFSLMR